MHDGFSYCQRVLFYRGKAPTQAVYVTATRRCPVPVCSQDERHDAALQRPDFTSFFAQQSNNNMFIRQTGTKLNFHKILCQIRKPSGFCWCCQRIATVRYVYINNQLPAYSFIGRVGVNSRAHDLCRVRVDLR
ncbi:hypothetical protein TcasGA2_TC014744 [Tribolium castaneum]|uniref:Uncharacterized protein n=1 Tax=Tribolium castaneum TaxID=7070 RepID=D6WJ92_TRICA|nr:hypothetical protein TcasGA2_TC014744 [Tribolium castaneum]